MPLAYYSRAATSEFWSEHWGGHTVAELLAVARRSPLTDLIERHLPDGGGLPPAGRGGDPGRGGGGAGAGRCPPALGALPERSPPAARSLAGPPEPADPRRRR